MTTEPEALPRPRLSGEPAQNVLKAQQNEYRIQIFKYIANKSIDLRGTGQTSSRHQLQRIFIQVLKTIFLFTIMRMSEYF